MGPHGHGRAVSIASKAPTRSSGWQRRPTMARPGGSFMTDARSRGRASAALLGLFPRPHAYARGTGACSDHRRQVWTASVLAAVGVVDSIIDGTVDRLKNHPFREGGGAVAPGPLL